jgi:nitroreductase
MNALSDLLARHRSIRAFKPDPVAPELVEQVATEALAGASSSGNLNSVSVVLTRDPSRKQQLYELHSRQAMVLQAPLVVTVCADWWRTRQWLAARGARDNFDNFIGYHVAAFDAMILAQNMALGFESRGLGICYLGTTLYAMREIADLLELPETCVPVTTLVVGHPDESPPQRDRLPTSAWLHEETYRAPTGADIDAAYAERERRGWARYQAIPELRDLMAQHGIASLAEFYTSKVKYDPDLHRRLSGEIRELLEDKRFLP